MSEKKLNPFQARAPRQRKGNVGKVGNRSNALKINTELQPRPAKKRKRTPTFNHAKKSKRSHRSFLTSTARFPVALMSPFDIVEISKRDEKFAWDVFRGLCAHYPTFVKQYLALDLSDKWEINGAWLEASDGLRDEPEIDFEAEAERELEDSDFIEEQKQMMRDIQKATPKMKPKPRVHDSKPLSDAAEKMVEPSEVLDLTAPEKKEEEVEGAGQSESTNDGETAREKLPLPTGKYSLHLSASFLKKYKKYFPDVLPGDVRLSLAAPTDENKPNWHRGPVAKFLCLAEHFENYPKGCTTADPVVLATTGYKYSTLKPLRRLINLACVSYKGYQTQIGMVENPRVLFNAKEQKEIVEQKIVTGMARKGFKPNPTMELFDRVWPLIKKKGSINNKVAQKKADKKKKKSARK